MVPASVHGASRFHGPEHVPVAGRSAWPPARGAVSGGHPRPL